MVERHGCLLSSVERDGRLCKTSLVYYGESMLSLALKVDIYWLGLIELGIRKLCLAAWRNS